MIFKFCHILFLLFLAKTFGTDSEIETLDFDFFDSSQNEPDQVIKDLQSSDSDIQLKAIKEIQALFKSPEYLNDFIDNEYVPFLIKTLNSENTTIQLEVIEALNVIAKSSIRNAREIVRENGVPQLIKLSHSSNTTVAANCIHIIGHLIYNNTKSRNQVLKLGLAEHLLEFIEPTVTAELLNETVRVMLILTMNHDRLIPQEAIDIIVPAFKTLILHSNPDIAYNATLALTYLTDNQNSRYDIALENDLIKHLIRLIYHGKPKTQGVAIKLIANVVNETNEECESFMSYSAFKLFPKLLMHENDQTVQDTLKLLTKLFNLSKPETALIFDSEIVPLIILHLARITNIEVQREAAYAVTSATIFASSKQISYMIDMNVINAMCHFLLKVEKVSDEFVEVILLGYKNIFSKAAHRYNELHQKLGKCQGLEAISRLERHNNKTIKKMAFDIIGTYCDKN